MVRGCFSVNVFIFIFRILFKLLSACPSLGQWPRVLASSSSPAMRWLDGWPYSLLLFLRQWVRQLISSFRMKMLDLEYTWHTFRCSKYSHDCFTIFYSCQKNGYAKDDTSLRYNGTFYEPLMSYTFCHR